MIYLLLIQLEISILRFSFFTFQQPKKGKCTRCVWCAFVYVLCWVNDDEYQTEWNLFCTNAIWQAWKRKNKIHLHTNTNVSLYSCAPFYTCSIIWSLGVVVVSFQWRPMQNWNFNSSIASTYVKVQQICTWKTKCCILPPKSIEFYHFLMWMAKNVWRNGP